MRFNDMIATVLAASAERPEAREAQWRQLVDLLAQPQPGAKREREAAYAFLRAERGKVEPAVRAKIAGSLAGLAIDPDLLVFFAEDRAEVAAPLLRSARLRGEDWLRILPRLGPTARALLRHRQDLPRNVLRALAAFGPADLVLSRGDSSLAATDAEAGKEGSQIRELVDRIEAYQRRRREPEPDTAAIGQASVFCWETGTEGVIRWVDEAPREPLIGFSLSAHDGVGNVARAFEKRAPFRDVRLDVPGEGAVAGAWRISGVPYFDRYAGAFLGYRGAARRPRRDEIVPATPGTPFGPDLPPDSVRQLVHELRTPLNAIMGFAELIEGEFMGPAAVQYRDRATQIMAHAKRLLSTVDDLDTAARIETQRLDVGGGRVDVAALLEQILPSYEAAARQRGARLEIDIAGALPDAALAPEAAERLIARLLAATIGLAQAGETIAIALDRCPGGDGKTLRFAIDRPIAVAGLNETALLDPAYSPPGDWPTAPSLGLGFAFSLVRKLVEANGGELAIGPDAVELLLPAADA